MSELKATTVYDAYWKATINGDSSILVYLKSEVDKVIVKLESKLDIYKRGFKEDDKIIASLSQKLRHQKYKRCLAMAKLCHEKRLWWYSKGYGFEKYDKFWEKWQKRWLELAEKFKELK